MNDVARLKQRLQESEQRNEALQSEIASLRAEFASFRSDHEALIDATRVLSDERDSLQKRVAELEVVNKRLVDMLWGRRTERRSDSPDQMLLSFAAKSSDDTEPHDDEDQEIITAQEEADEATDQELLRRLKARRKARQKKRQAGNEDFPPDIERREQVIDLSEEDKKGLKQIGVKITQRLCFEKPHAYVKVIKRPQYVMVGQPEKGVSSAPPPLSIVEGCKYDFSVISAVCAMKFAFHMPTYRQQDWFAQCGWFPSRSTVNDLINYAVATIGPLYRQMWQLLLRRPILWAMRVVSMRAWSNVAAAGSYTRAATRMRGANLSKRSRTMRSWRRRASRFIGNCMTSRNARRLWTPPGDWNCASATPCQSGIACGAGLPATQPIGHCPAVQSAKRSDTCATIGRR